LLLALALVARVAFAGAIAGFPNDIACFKSWAISASDSIIGLYNEGFIDYPPGYMYILWIVGTIRKLFDIPYDTALYTTIVKMPPILCDVACGYLLYHLPALVLGGGRAAPAMAKGRGKGPGGQGASGQGAGAQGAALAGASGGAGGPVAVGPGAAGGAADGGAPALSENARLLAVAFYVFNPAVYFVSTVWAQIDSVLALVVLAALCLLLRRQYAASGALYAFGCLVKPQGIIFLAIPGLLLLFRLIRREAGALLAIAKEAGGGLACLFVLLIPFEATYGWDWVIKLYTSTLGGYAYATVNAFNFYALFHGNWTPVTDKLLGLPFSAWGIAGYAVFFGLTIYYMWRAVAKGAPAHMPVLASGAILVGVVTFGHMMHERYFFQAMLLTLAAYVLGGGPWTLASYVLMSAAGFFNILVVFSAYYFDHIVNFYDTPAIYFIAAANVLSALSLWFGALRGARGAGAGAGAPPPGKGRGDASVPAPQGAALGGPDSA
jgi:Gpi18-like mannosyltransferase